MANGNESEDDRGVDRKEVVEKKSGNGKMKILILIVVAMLGEAGLFFFLGVGSSGASDATTTETMSGEDGPQPDEEEELVEVEVHDFSVTNTAAAADTVIHISFKVHALLAIDQENGFKEKITASHKVRVRESIETIFRSATMEDLTDSSLSTLKRLVREEINRVLRQSYVVNIVFNDYKTIQQ